MSLPKASHSVTSSREWHRAESPASGRPAGPSHHGSGVLYRKDIFYSGSLINIPEYRTNRATSATSLSSAKAELAVNHRDSIPTSGKVPGRSGKSWTRFFTCSKEVRDVFAQMTDTSLLRDSVFLLFALSNFFTNIGFNVPFVYIKDRALDMGLAEGEEASMLLSVIGIANTAGRVILGYLSDKTWVNRLALYNICLTICGLTTAMSSLCITYPWMAAYSASFGLTAGAYVSLTSVILVDLLGLDKLTNAFGLLLVFEGVACLVGPPITGWLYDAFGTYDPGFYVCGVMIAVSGLMLFSIPCIKRKSTCKDENKTPAVAAVNGDCPDALNKV